MQGLSSSSAVPIFWSGTVAFNWLALPHYLSYVSAQPSGDRADFEGSLFWLYKELLRKPHYAQMALMNLIFVYYKALVQQKNLYPIVLKALKVKICPIVSKAGRKAESAQQ